MDIERDHELWERLLRADEANLAYFGERCELPGVSLFTAERPDAPEFDLAVIYRVAAREAEATLREIIRHFRTRGRTPRVRLTPISAPEDWPARLANAGFVETEERLVYHLIPEVVGLASNPAVAIRRVVTPADAEAYSAIQVAGFQVPAAHREWDLALVKRHLELGDRDYYLASIEDRLVGAGATTLLPEGVAALWGGTTLPEARRSGVATSLIQRRNEEARATGRRLIFGTAAAGGYAAGLQERLGFVPLFTTRTFVRPDSEGRGSREPGQDLGDGLLRRDSSPGPGEPAGAQPLFDPGDRRRPAGTGGRGHANAEPLVERVGRAK